MTTKKLMIVGAVIVAGVLVWWFAFRRKAVVAVGYATGGVAPSPGAAITTLLATPPKELVNAGITTAVNYLLPPVGAGVTTTKTDYDPNAKCPPPPYVGYAPGNPNHWCAGEKKCPPTGGGSICGVLRQLGMA